MAYSLLCAALFFSEIIMYTVVKFWTFSIWKFNDAKNI
jgi:hypothetical protein